MVELKNMASGAEKQNIQARVAELEAELKGLKRAKRYGLVWESKPEEIVEACKKNVPILKLKEKKAGIDPVITTDETKDENILIEGDNYHSLSILNYTHAGKIDVIYADPPYNTGASDWRYNNDYVDDSDAFRHSKWLSFMDNRLRIARNLLADDGIICVTIDDYELPRLVMLLDDIFGEEHRLGSVVIRNNPQGRSTVKGFSINHEYALFYEKSAKSVIGRLPRSDKQLERYPESDEEGLTYLWENFRKTGSDSHRTDRPKQFYPLYIRGESIRLPKMEWNNSSKSWVILDKKSSDEVEVWPIDSAKNERVWKWGQDRVLENPSHLQVRRPGGRIEIHRRNYPTEGSLPNTLWDKPKYASGSHGTNLLTKMFMKSHIFDFPKSVYAVEDCIRVCSPKKDAVVLDFFAGSGTTGHAVLQLNKEDDGNRKFILCTNNENGICEEVTYERIRHVIKGYKSKEGESLEGLGGNLRYYKTDLVDIDNVYKVSDNGRIALTYQAGEMLGLRENTLNEVQKNDWWQIFEGNGKTTAIYFKEDKTKLSELVDLLEKKNSFCTLYIFSWGKNEYKSEYSSTNLIIEDIPEPILEVYKEINRI